jgi:hypothetical protein
MNGYELDWDDDRIDHIAQHNVDISEVLELYYASHLRVRTTRDKFRLYGQTAAGRYLLVVVGRRRWSRSDWLVTARDMTPTERRYYQRRRR